MNQIRTTLTLLAVAALLPACDRSHANERVMLDEITGGTATVRTQPSLCKLVRLADRVGVFDVTEMYSQVEADHVNDEPTLIVTYIELNAIDIWTGPAAEQVTVRTPGGRGTLKYDGKWQEVRSTSNVRLTTGETIVYFEFKSQFSAARGDYPDIMPYTLFRTDDGVGYASADLFVNDPIELPDFKALVTQIAEAPDSQPCPVDVCPESGCPPFPTPDMGTGDTDMGNSDV